MQVSKDGIMTGTLQNISTGDFQQIEGAVHKSSQRSASTIAGKAVAVMETGISNLTKMRRPHRRTSRMVRRSNACWCEWRIQTNPRSRPRILQPLEDRQIAFHNAGDPAGGMAKVRT